MSNPNNGVCTTSFTDVENGALVGVSLFGAILSMIGSGFIIFSYFFFVRLRTFPYKLIMLLSVSDYFASFSYLIGVSTEKNGVCLVSGRCVFAAVLNQYFGIASFMWTCVVAYNCYAVLVKQLGRAVEDKEPIYHGISWGVPLVLTIIAAAMPSLGDAGNWCWIKQEYELTRFFTYYLPLILAMLFAGIVFALISRAVRGSQQRETINFRLRLYLGIFVIIRFFPIINRLHASVPAPPRPPIVREQRLGALRFISIAAQDWASNDKLFALYLLQSIFEPLQGFANALVYGFNRQVASTYRDYYRTRFGGGGGDGSLQSQRQAMEQASAEQGGAAGIEAVAAGGTI